MRVKSKYPYENWKIAFAAPGIPKPATAPYGIGNFKADVKIEGTEWQTVSVPFSSFSWDTSRYTGECSTTDADGTKHRCCGTDHPEVCPTARYLRSINQLMIWAEGAVGDIYLEIESFSVSMETQAAVAGTVSQAEKRPQPSSLPKEFDTCTNAIQSNLRYNISTFQQSQYFPNETLAVSVCCDKRMQALAEPQFLFQAPNIQLFAVLNKTSGVHTFYDSACGVPVFRAPINRTMAEFEEDTNEHGWPSFRDGEVILENVRTHKDTGYVISSCNTHLGSFLPDAQGSRWCIDLSCISGNPIVLEPQKTPQHNNEHKRQPFSQSIPAALFGILLLGLCMGGIVVGIKKVAAGMSNPRPDGDVAHVTLDETEKDVERC